MALNIVIVEKTGVLKSLAIKEFKEEELFKKCGFKKAEDFVKQHEWSMKTEGRKFIIQVFAKTEGRPNSENKYDFPPPIDTKLFFGNCVIVAKIKGDTNANYINLTLEMWEKMYEKLFGGFEDLTTTATEDENEEDELENVPQNKKTKHGYLKDGFVVDSSDGDEEEEDDEEDEEEEEDDSETNNEEDDELVLEDLGSELTEESYDYESESEDDKKDDKKKK